MKLNIVKQLPVYTNYLLNQVETYIPKWLINPK